MIKIDRPVLPPAILIQKGQKAASQLKRRYTRSQAAYDSGQRKFVFDSAIYSHATVKTALQNMQSNKCCFCENKLSHSYGDVEHYRPKAGYQQSNTGQLQKPGYYWLAYDWDNLLLSCEICNRSYKKNFFPLSNNNKRARNHQSSLGIERPLIIDPTKEQPSKYLFYRGTTPKAVNGNKKGLATIKRTGIDDPKRIGLNEERFNHLMLMKLLFEVSINDGLDMPLRIKAKEQLEKAIQPNAKFSLMMNGAMRDEFRFI